MAPYETNRSTHGDGDGDGDGGNGDGNGINRSDIPEGMLDHDLVNPGQWDTTPLKTQRHMRNQCLLLRVAKLSQMCPAQAMSRQKSSMMSVNVPSETHTVCLVVEMVMVMVLAIGVMGIEMEMELETQSGIGMMGMKAGMNVGRG